MDETEDMWGDIIRIEPFPKFISITIEGFDRTTGTDLDPAQARKLIRKLKKALDEMEVM